MTISFVVPGDPVAWQRAGYAGKSKHFYTKTKTREFKAKVLAYYLASERLFLVGPLELTVRFYFKRTKAQMRAKVPTGPIPHTAKPDLDNLVKSIKDALSKKAFKDDAQICDSHQSKRYCEKYSEARTEIEIKEA